MSLDDDDPPAPQGFVAGVGRLTLSGVGAARSLLEVFQRTLY